MYNLGTEHSSTISSQITVVKEDRFEGFGLGRPATKMASCPLKWRYFR